ncbi:hypothetical protein [Streptomyces rochei]|uniref:hypothetical protein n=1 Tax=Streptomyces rochei TaxID=1928 RepID=UPI0033B8ECE8
MSGTSGTDGLESARPGPLGAGFLAGAFAAAVFFLVGLVFFVSAIGHSLNQVLDLEVIFCQSHCAHSPTRQSPSKVARGTYQDKRKYREFDGGNTGASTRGG